MQHVPILFLVFNRPGTTRQVFEKIREQKPKQLFIAADGPRPGRPEDLENCQEVQSIVQAIDWDCDFKTLFRAENLGCGQAVSQGITWFFDHVEEGIILEDDTLPNPSFFSFCAHLLEYYRHDTQVMHIAGSNFQLGKKWGKASYYFSHYNHIWGWATWRRAWQNYEFDMPNLEDFLNSWLFQSVLRTPAERDYWALTLRETHRGLIDTWDHQWRYTMWMHGGIAVTPNVNMVSNLGFGANATHTIQAEAKTKELKTDPLLQITHPPKQEVYKSAEYRAFRNNYQAKPTLLNQIRNLLYRLLPESFFLQWRKLKKKLNP